MTHNWAVFIPHASAPLEEHFVRFSRCPEHPDKLFLHNGTRALPVLLETPSETLFLLVAYNENLNFDRGLMYQLQGALSVKNILIDLDAFKLLGVNLHTGTSKTISKTVYMKDWVKDPMYKNMAVLKLSGPQ